MNWCVKIIPVVFLLMGLVCGQAQTLFTYGNQKVSVQEFMNAFNRNPDTLLPRKQALENYYKLYSQYKLKVQDAYDEKIDKEDAQVAELQRYRNSLVDQHLAKMINEEEFYQAAFQAGSKDWKLHYAYVAKEKTNAAGTADSMLRALKKGKSFGDVLQQFDGEPTLTAAGGRLGWVSPFVLPYDLFQAISKLKSGELSQIIDGQTAYHIFKLEDVRPSIGWRYTSHIFFAELAAQTNDEKKQTKQLADSIYNLLKQDGKQFERLVSLYSNDRKSANSGGALSPAMPGVFEQKIDSIIYQLPSAGSISTPVKSSSGWHIIRLDSVLLPNQKDWEQSIRKQANDNGWMIAYRKHRMEALKNQVAFQPNPIADDALWQYTNASLQNDSLALAKLYPLQGKSVLFTIDNRSTTLSDWIAYLRPKLAANGRGNDWKNQYDEFVQQNVVQAYTNDLEKHDPALAQKLVAFKEANMLFEIMNRKVWEPAQTNDVAIVNYYNQHKASFVWNENAVVLILSSNTKETLSTALGLLQHQPKNWRATTAYYAPDLLADSIRLAYNELPKCLQQYRQSFKTGYVAPLCQNNGDSTYYSMYILEARPAGTAKTIDECRFELLDAYQKQLENDWMDLMQKKYPIKRNENAWEALLKD